MDSLNVGLQIGPFGTGKRLKPADPEYARYLWIRRSIFAGIGCVGFAVLCYRALRKARLLKPD